MRTRHPARLAARIVCRLIEPHPVDYEAIDALLDAEAAREAEAQGCGSQGRNVHESRPSQASPA